MYTSNYDMLIGFTPHVYERHIRDKNVPIILVPFSLGFHYIYIKDKNIPIMNNCDMLIGFPLHIYQRQTCPNYV